MMKTTSSNIINKELETDNCFTLLLCETANRHYNQFLFSSYVDITVVIEKFEETNKYPSPSASLSQSFISIE